MFTVFRKRPGLDEDMCWEDDIPYFDNQKDAEQCAKEYTEIYNDDDWNGHPRYKDKFYVQEISEEYIREMENRWANQMAASM